MAFMALKTIVVVVGRCKSTKFIVFKEFVMNLLASKK